MATLPELLKSMVEMDGSDLHIATNTPPQVRVHGHLQRLQLPDLSPAETKQLVYSVLTDSQKKRFEETMELDFSFGIKAIGSRFRCNVFNQRGAVGAVYRLIPEKIRTFGELGLPTVLANLAERPRGLVLITGPTGSGKSTTLAAMIEYINANFKKHIVTMEDPIEFVFEDNQSVIEQREVGLDTLSFEHALKHVLRQDPDIIMIGEMRDATSFTAAMSAADTGHLVLSTLHTTNASQSISRILDFFKAEEREQIRRQLAGTLQAVVCQRMVATVANSMTPALEIMLNTPTVKKLIEENRLDKLPAAIETGNDEGMINFNQSLFQLVKDGKVSKEEALGKASNPQALEMNFKGIFLDEGRRILQ